MFTTGGLISIFTARRPPRHTVGKPAGLFAGLGFVLMLAGCSGLQVSDPAGPPLIDRLVDTLVLEPISTSRGTTASAAELDALKKTLGQDLSSRGLYRVMDRPRVRLPNVAHLGGVVRKLATNDKELQGGGLLRTIEIEAAISLRYPYMETPPAPLILTRAYSFQKIYPPGTSVPSAAQDREVALVELGHVFTEVLFPTPDSPPIPLRTGEDEDDDGQPVRLLEKANDLAQDLNYADSVRVWRMVLFDPVPQLEEKTFRYNQRAKRVLTLKGLSEDQLTRLEPLMEEEEEPFYRFKDLLAEHFSQPDDLLWQEDVVAQSSLENYYIYLNLADAHYNLAQVHIYLKELDLASYHLAMSYLLLQKKSDLDNWTEMMEKRGFPRGTLNPEQWIALYQHLSPPSRLPKTQGKREHFLLYPEEEALEDMEVKVPGAKTPAPNKPIPPTETPASPEVPPAHNPEPPTANPPAVNPPVGPVPEHPAAVPGPSAQPVPAPTQPTQPPPAPVEAPHIFR
ncbi:MAG: hypothetical protein OEV94_00145 [Deltaproteobacteria bacterium]|nr:hypothetical protein [Deltaproteobacteria bacterium]